jgi:hypothetical protein
LAVFVAEKCFGAAGADVDAEKQGHEVSVKVVIGILAGALRDAREAELRNSSPPRRREEKRGRKVEEGKERRKSFFPCSIFYPPSLLFSPRLCGEDLS